MTATYYEVACFNTWPDENTVTHVNCIVCGASVINNTNWRGQHETFHRNLTKVIVDLGDTVKACVDQITLLRGMIEPLDGSYPPGTGDG